MKVMGAVGEGVEELRVPGPQISEDACTVNLMFKPQYYPGIKGFLGT